MKAVVSRKGQVTIPKRLRDPLGIRPGDLLDFQEEQGRLVAGKSVQQDPFDAVYGIVELGRPTGDLIADLRGDAEPG
jgi:antitoxin PrlF